MAKSPLALITGGHLSPALATIDILEEQHWEIIYVGRQSTADDGGISDEYQVITGRHIPFISITSGKWHRYSLWAALKSSLRVPIGFIQSLKLLTAYRPDVIISFGGYLSTPVIVAAWCLRIPIVTHEQTLHAGLANRFNAYFANKVCISFQASRQYFPERKTIFTGNPVRTQALKPVETPPSLKNLPHKTTLYITGGNQGSTTLNETMLQLIPELTQHYNIIHSIGTHPRQNTYEDQASQLHQQLPASQKKAYVSARYFTPQQIGAVFNAADLVISRAGANTCTELANLQKPALLIPLTTGQKNEQLHNAQLMQQLGLAEILLESEMSPSNLQARIQVMCGQLKKYHAQPEEIHQIFPLDAAERLVTIAQSLCQ